MNQIPMTTREAIEDALYCMAYTLVTVCPDLAEKTRTVAAMELLCQQYGLPIGRFLPAYA